MGVEGRTDTKCFSFKSMVPKTKAGLPLAGLKASLSPSVFGRRSRVGEFGIWRKDKIPCSVPTAVGLEPAAQSSPSLPAERARTSCGGVDITGDPPQGKTHILQTTKIPAMSAAMCIFVSKETLVTGAMI